MSKQDLYKARLEAIKQKAQLANEKAQKLVDKTEKLKNDAINLVQSIAQDSQVSKQKI
jgi:hypothetical protein